MKRQSLVLIAVAIAGAGATGCFKDPVSNLRNGPAVMSVTSSAVFLRTGDSINVTATLLDDAGNVMPLTDSATWTTGDPSIALAHNDHSLTVPGDAYSRGTILAVDSVTGGWTNVIVAARGIADTIRVVVIPAKFTAQHVAYAGTAKTDTVVIPQSVLPPVARGYFEYTAPDTLVLNGTSILKFDTSKVTVTVATTNGASKGLIVSKTPDQLEVVFETGTYGKALVRHWLFTPGNSEVGTVAVDSLFTDTVAVAAWHQNGPYGGTVTQVGDTMTVTAATGMAFSNSTEISLTSGSDTLINGLPIPSATGYVLDRSASQIRILAPATLTDQRVTIRDVTMAASGTGVDSVTFDSLKTNDVGYAMAQATLPAAGVVQSGDTLTVNAVGPMVFDTSTAAGDTLDDGTPAISQVMFGTKQAIVIARTPTQFSYVLSPVDYTGPVAVTNTFVGLTRIPSLPTTGSYTMAAFAIPAANVNLGGGRLNDTVTVTAPAGLSFTTSGSVSNVLLGNQDIPTSDTAWVLSRTAGTMKVFAKRGGSSPVTVTNVSLGTVTAPTIATVASMKIDSVATDYVTQQDQSAATVLTIPANDTLITYQTALPGAANGGFAQSYSTFTTTATHTIKTSVAWFGSGNPYSSGTNTIDYTEDLDLLLCDASTACDESAADLGNFAGATTAQPQTVTVTGLPAAQYWINVAGFNVGYSIEYKLTVILQ
jgi:hypothetical protein